MQKVRKLVTTIMIAALITAMEGITILPLSHHVKADTNTVSQTSQAENDLTKYKKINGIGDNTVLGADFSHYQLQKNAWKKVWKNYKGIEVSNVFEYVRSQGINTISVKVAVNPTKDKEGNESYLSLENAKKTLKEAKKAGLKTNVTLLYSDDITYAGVQKLPDGWDTDSAEKKALEYTKNVIKELKAAGKQMIISSVKCPWKDSEGKASITTQTKSIYDYLQATINEKNAGGLIYDDADFVGAWDSFFDENGQAMSSLAIFAYAQGNQVDVSTYKDPWEYGGDTGLKNLTASVKKLNNMSQSSIRGMDISSYTALKKAGVKYYDFDGKETSLLKVLHDNGVNYIRIRIWNDPTNEKGETYGGGANDVAAGLEIAKEAAQYDMKLLLDFHYSDFWADPALQKIPKAWEKDKNDTEKMKQNVYDFTKDTIKKFQEVGADIGMVQVGNEITNGMLDIMPDYSKGETYKDTWGNAKNAKILCGYLKAGIKAVRECTPKALVTLHLESMGYGKCSEIMNAWERNGVDYDVFGSSFYQFWQGNSSKNALAGLQKIENLAKSRGKMYAVMETSWLNSLKDADGTSNVIGEGHANAKVYSDDPQGQVDALTDMYQTLLSNDNGLGAFYWEGAWIPVKAGWTNWKYNKDMSDRYGTGWAAQGAKGYYPDNKMYYNGQPAWGGSSWDNQTLFDSNGYPLQSLKFYKDSVSKGKEQIIALKIVDKNGKEVYPTQYVKVEVGKTRKITLPKFSGYYPSNKNYQLTVKGVKEENATQSVVYTRTAAGPAISYNYRVKVTKKNYKLYKNFKWKKSKTKVYKKTYVAKYRYDHKNGNKYLALYTKGGKFVGYINKKAVKRLGSATQPEQGKAYTYGKRVKIKSKKYKLYKNFKWKKSKTKVYKKTYVAKYRYKHENGNKYLALYTKSGKFIGYINSKAAKVVK